MERAELSLLETSSNIVVSSFGATTADKKFSFSQVSINTLKACLLRCELYRIQSWLCSRADTRIKATAADSTQLSPESHSARFRHGGTFAAVKENGLNLSLRHGSPPAPAVACSQV